MNEVMADRLAPLRARMAAQRAAVRPVSKLWFELSDKAAFDRCIDLSLKWMAPRAQVTLPPSAWEGGSFDVTDVIGANPTKAARISAADGAIWAARLDWPDPSYPRTWVSEFFAERRRGRLSRFGAQLTCVVRGESPQFDVTRPTVVRHVLESLSAEADGWTLTDAARRVDSGEVSDLATLLYEPSRRLPVLAISDAESGGPRISPDELARHVAGAVHIVHLSAEASWELTRTIGKRMSVFNGAARLYLPGLSEETEDPYQHPLWFLQDPDSDFTKVVAARVLPLAFLRGPSDDSFWRFAEIRDIAARHTISQHPARTANESLRSELQILRLEHSEAIEQREAWESLAHEEQGKRLTAEAELERLSQETFRLKAKAAALEHRLDAHKPVSDVFVQDRPLESFDDLEVWAEEVLGESVYIHQAALKDCRKNGHKNTLERIGRAMIVIRDFVVPARLKGGRELKELARARLTALGMEDSPCFVDRDEAKRSPGYTIQYEGKTCVLFDHIKYGNGYDNANQIRIYYLWDEERSRFVIGKMPSHLRNNMTN